MATSEQTPQEDSNESANSKARTPRSQRLLRWSGGIVIVALAYLALGWVASNHIPGSSKVLGEDISGLSRTAAEQRIEQSWEQHAAKPVKVTAGDKTAEVDASQLQMQVDSEATVDQMLSFSLNPATIWRRLVGSAHTDLVYQAEPAAAAKQLAEELSAQPKSANLQWKNGRVDVVADQPGQSVDGTAAAQAAIAALSDGKHEATVKFSPVKAQILAKAAEKLKTDQIDPLVAHPLELVGNGETVSVPVDQLQKFISFDNGGSELKTKIDTHSLVELARSQNDKLVIDARNAGFTFEGGKPQMTPSADGQEVKFDQLQTDILSTAKEGKHRVNIPVVVRQPNLTTEAAEKLGIKEVTGEFTTHFYVDKARTQNLRRGMEQITGKLILPGETFSLEKALGDISEANGYTSSGVISNGLHVDALGGGLSQVCVTTLNAAFFAGLDITEHKPHSEYFKRYPMGRECTLWVGQHDLKFKNNTPYGVLMQGYLQGQNMTVKVWSTKYWDVKTTTSERSQIVQPKTEVRHDHNCQPSPANNPGFKVSVYRSISHDGQPGPELNWTWRYRPSNRIVCH